MERRAGGGVDGRVLAVGEVEAKVAVGPDDQGEALWGGVVGPASTRPGGRQRELWEDPGGDGEAGERVQRVERGVAGDVDVGAAVDGLGAAGVFAV